MDERTTGMTSTGSEKTGHQNGTTPISASQPNASETAAQLEDDIEHIRNHLTDVASELDRRRHRFFDLPGQAREQLRKHGKPIAIGTVALAALGLGIWWWRSRSQRTVTGRLLSSVRDRLPDALTSGEWFEQARKRLAEAIHPEPPTHTERNGLIKVSTAAAGAAASVLGKRLAGQLARSQWPSQDEQNQRAGLAR